MPPAQRRDGMWLLTEGMQVLKPMSRLGGITYGRVTEAIEIPRPDFEKDVGGQDGLNGLKKTL